MQLKLSHYRILIKGAGDLATGVALRLHRAGFPVFMTEIDTPLAVRRTVAFAQAVYDGECQVEGVWARRCTIAEAPSISSDGKIPVLIDPQTTAIASLRPIAVVDAIIAKYNTGTQIGDAPLVIGLGPGFTAGVDCHCVVETHRGHNLGRVLWSGAAEANTGEPGELPGIGQRASRVLRAPAAGCVWPHREIGAFVTEGEMIAEIVNGGECVAEIRAPFAGVVRGLIHRSLFVSQDVKIGDIDPRLDPASCFTVSDKSLAIGGSVLEAVMGHLTK
ncbi:MAG: EF2563 family selenium-dependent molybdenum hydroxylase system protein [Anaerolineales bacterium]|nr:EF2563 family selenium-dependent molybdenum hydroxylase system protein [Anaerolineales bacterium]